MAAQLRATPRIAVVEWHIMMLGNAMAALQRNMPCISEVAQQKTTTPIAKVAQ
jgi:hypothetical protein